MSEKLYEAFEVCLKALETGAELESVLMLFPDRKDKLRPLLEASIGARSLALSAVPVDAMQRGRARVLQHAAEMREAARRPRGVRFVFTRLATSLALALVFLLGGTGIVNASSGALPGDNLYPVKRSWEEVRLWFAFSPEGQEELESEYEQERLNEVDELLAEGREEAIAFYGIVTAQDGDYWLVSGVPVQITAKTQTPAEPVLVGMPVTVVGRTNAQGFIEAQLVGALNPDVSLPPFEPTESEGEGGDHDKQEGGGLAAPQVEDDGDDQQIQPRTFEFHGVVTSTKDEIWTINGQRVDVSNARINGNISVGSFVKFEGYYTPDGNFIVLELEIRNEDSSNASSPETFENNDNSSGSSKDDSDSVSNDNDSENSGSDSSDKDDESENDSSGSSEDDSTEKEAD